MTKEVPRTSVLRDEELIAYLRLQGLDKDIAAADRIEALIAERDEAINQLDSARHSVDVLEKRCRTLIAERDALFRRATLAEEWRDHDKTRAEAAEAKLAKAVEALEDISGNGNAAGRNPQLMSAKARATLAEIKGESHE